MEKPQHPNYAQFVELKFEKLLMIHSQKLKLLFMQINETVKNVKRFYYRLMPGAWGNHSTLSQHYQQILLRLKLRKWPGAVIM